MERIFQFLAVVLIGAAAFSFVRGWHEWAFVSGVLAACSFFIAVRFQVKGRLAARAASDGTKEPENDVG